MQKIIFALPFTIEALSNLFATIVISFILAVQRVVQLFLMTDLKLKERLSYANSLGILDSSGTTELFNPTVHWLNLCEVKNKIP